MSTLNNNTQTSLLEATTKLAMFGAKGTASLLGGASGMVIGASDALAEHINTAPESISAGINNRSLKENFDTMKAVTYRGTRRTISNYRDDNADDVM